MLICPTCRSQFEGEEHFCPRDGSPLSPQLSSSGPARAHDPAADRLIGRVLGGRYRLVERLGQGGMGTVYRAVHTLMEKPVAVKILRAELSNNAEAVTRFHREARSASRLDHDHCIRVTDFGQSDDGLLYLVMELLDGTTLGQLAREAPIPAGRTAAIGLAIAEALAHAHEAGIIHRDLKPDNVFLARRPSGRELVKVLDFGLAKLASDSARGPSITRDGTVFGTPEYMAPEQAEGRRLDGRTDLYALGAILYQLVTGQPPFCAASFVALLTKQVSELPVPPTERCPELEIPAALEAIILRCLEKRPDARYASAQAVADALLPLAERDPSLPVVLHELPAPVVERAHPRRRLGLLGALVLFAAGLTAFYLRGRIDTLPAPLRAAAEKPMRRPPAAAVSPAAAPSPATSVSAARGQEAMAAAALGEHQRLKALYHFHEALRLAPTDAEPRARLAAALYDFGQAADACVQARAALALDPSSDLARHITKKAHCFRMERRASFK